MQIAVLQFRHHRWPVPGRTESYIQNTGKSPGRIFLPGLFQMIAKHTCNILNLDNVPVKALHRGRFNESINSGKNRFTLKKFYTCLCGCSIIKPKFFCK